MRHLLHLLLLLALTLNVTAQQNTPRVLPTVADLVSRPPATLAATTVGTNTTFLALVVTTGDTVAGTGQRTWTWLSTSSAATNTSADGIEWRLAYPYGASTGRWQQVSSFEAQRLQVEIDAISGGAVVITPKLLGATADGIDDDTDEVIAATAAAAATGSRTLDFTDGTYLIDIGLWSTPDNFTIRGGRGARIIPKRHPTASFSAEEITWPLLTVGNNTLIEGVPDSFLFDGRRFDTNYNTGIDYTRRLMLVRAIDKTNVTFRSVGFTDCLWAPIYGRRVTNVVIDNCRWKFSNQAAQIYEFSGLQVRNNLLEDMMFLHSAITPQDFKFQSGDRCEYSNNRILRTLATSGGSSSLVSVNFWGVSDPLVFGNYIGEFNPASTMGSSGIYIDGGRGARVSYNNIKTRHAGASYGIALEGTFDVVVDNNDIAGRQSGAASIGSGIYFRSGGGWRSAAKPGGIQWRDPGTLEHTKSVTYNADIINNRIDGYGTGIFFDPSGSRVLNNRVTGSINTGIRIEPKLSWGDGIIFVPPTTPLARDNLVERNIVQNVGGWGIWLSGSDNLTLRNNFVWNNDQAGGGAGGIGVRIAASGTTTSGSTTNAIKSATTLVTLSSVTTGTSTTNNIVTSGLTSGDHVNSYIYFASLGEGRFIEANTSGTITPRVAFSTAPASNASYTISSSRAGQHIYLPPTTAVPRGQQAVVESNTHDTFNLRYGGVATPPGTTERWVLTVGILGRVTLDDNQIADTQTTEVIPDIVSLDPTQTYATGTPFMVSTEQAQLFLTGRRLILKGVLTGDVDAIVQVLHPDDTYADSYWVTPVSPGSGTFATAPGMAIKTGTGTITYIDSLSVPYQYSLRTLVTGTGTSYLSELDDNIWIKADTGLWSRTKTVETSTKLNLVFNQPSNYTNRPFTYSMVSVQQIPSQGRAYDFADSPVRLDFRPNNQIWGNAGGAGVVSPQGRLDLITAPDAIPRIIATTAYPTMEMGFSRMRFASPSPITITNLANASESARFSARGDGVTTIGVTNASSAFRGLGGANKLLTTNMMAHFEFSEGLWWVRVTE